MSRAFDNTFASSLSDQGAPQPLPNSRTFMCNFGTCIRLGLELARKKFVCVHRDRQQQQRRRKVHGLLLLRVAAFLREALGYCRSSGGHREVPRSLVLCSERAKRVELRGPSRALRSSEESKASKPKSNPRRMAAGVERARKTGGRRGEASEIRRKGERRDKHLIPKMSELS